MENKQSNVVKNLFKFFESIILIVLIGWVIMMVLETFFNQLIGIDDYSYDEPSDYDEYSSYDEYEEDYSILDYYDDYSYTDTEDSTSNLLPIQEFLNSESGKSFLKEPTQNQIDNYANVINTEISLNNTITNENAIETEDFYEDYDPEYIFKQDFEKQKKNMEIQEEGKSINNDLIISIENKNDDFVHDLIVYVIFYKSNEIVAIDTQDISIIAAKNKSYLKISDLPKEYDNYEVFISKYDYMEYYNQLLNDDVTYSTYVEDELVEIEIKNSSSRKIDEVCFTILYYDSTGKILEIDTAYDYSIRRNSTGNAIGYGVWDEEKEEYIDYADYKVILDYAEYYSF